MTLHSNFNQYRNNWLFQRQKGDEGVKRPLTPAQQEESERLETEDQVDNWLQDEAPLPF
jgi:hypothetical protein